MGKKSRAKKQQKGDGQANGAATAQADDRSTTVDGDKFHIETLCRVYVENFQPLTELKEENRRLKRPIIPVRFSTLMDRHVKPTIYKETVEKIRKHLAGHPLFFSFSFSCNGCCNYSEVTDHVETINVTVGTLKAEDVRGNQFIVHSSENYSSIGKCGHEDDGKSNAEFFIKLFKDTLNILFPEDSALHLKDIILLITEVEMNEVAAELMNKMNLKNVTHFTCLESIISCAEELVCNSYKKARRLVKLVYMYIHSYTIGDVSRGHAIFGTLADFENDVGLPKPLPKKLSLRNFIELSIYIFNYIDFFDKYFHDHEDITCEMLLTAVSDHDTRRELALIKAKFSSLMAVKQIVQSPETSSLHKTITAIEEFRFKLQKWPHDQFNNKAIEALFSDNVGYQTFLEYHRILNNKDSKDQKFLGDKLNLSLEYSKLFSHAPLTATSAVHFPSFTLLKQISMRVPASYLDVYSLIYSFQEETKRNSKAMAETLKNRTLLYNFNNAFDFTC